MKWLYYYFLQRLKSKLFENCRLFWPILEHYVWCICCCVVVKSSYYTDCNVMRKPNRTKQSLIHIIVVMKTPFDLKLFLLKKIIHRTNPNQHRHNYTVHIRRRLQRTILNSKKVQNIFPNARIEKLQHFENHQNQCKNYHN